MMSNAERRSLRAAVEERKATALALQRRVADPDLHRQLDVAARLFDDVSALFLAKVNPRQPQPDDELWLRGADAYFRAACVFLDGLELEHARRSTP